MIAAAGSCAECLGKLENHDMVRAGLLIPNGAEQMNRFRSQYGGSSPDLGGNLQPDSLPCEVSCSPCKSLDQETGL